MNSIDNVISANREYWTKRAATYSQDVRDGELNGTVRNTWLKVITEQVSQYLPGRALNTLKVLDIGTGPGFFAIILTAVGCNVTAIDLTPQMLAEAKENAGELADKINFREMNAEVLSFQDESFDLIVTRNLTWDLPHPSQAYAEWCRVLKKGGILINFDANWYRYLFDNDAKEAYAVDRVNSEAIGIYNVNPDVDYGDMEIIASEVPLSRSMRPAWDIETLSKLGMCVDTDEAIWKKLWSEEEKINYASTPMFLVAAQKR